MGIRLIVNLDDILLLNQTAQGAEKDFGTATKILEGCGFLINQKKSVAVATQSMQYLGLEVDSHTLSLSLKCEKIDSVVSLCQRLFHKDMVSLRDISSLLGSLSWAIQAVPFAQSHYRKLQWFFIQHVHFHNNNLQAKVILNSYSKADLKWWMQNLPSVKGKPLQASDPG